MVHNLNDTREKLNTSPAHKRGSIRETINKLRKNHKLWRLNYVITGKMKQRIVQAPGNRSEREGT